MKKRIEYCWDKRYTEGLERNINDFLVSSRSAEHGCPMKKISAFYGGAKNAFEDHFNAHLRYLSGEETYGDTTRTTLRVCSGVNQLFSKSLVYISPTDIAITYTRDHTVISNTPEDSVSFQVTKHPLIQTEYVDGGNLLNDRVALKFVPPFMINLPCDMLFLEPTWHTGYTPLRVMSGSVEKGVYTPSLFLEAPIYQDVNHIEIKKGQPLAYMYFVDKVDFSLKENDLKLPSRKSFIRGLFSV